MAKVPPMLHKQRNVTLRRARTVLGHLAASIFLILQSLLFALLSIGPIPKHIGIIMDGNRRYARTHPSGPMPVAQGHMSGFNALRTVLETCLKLKGLSTITVYAFAIDNFRRDKDEVEALMMLAKRNLIELAGHGEVLARHSVRLRMVGRRELLPADVRLAVEKVERMTNGNRRATLNVCIPYSSRDEMVFSVEKNCQKPKFCEHVSVEQLDEQMMLAHSPPLDILIRTSGVNRLSDFMLWQVRTGSTIAPRKRKLNILAEHRSATPIYQALLAIVRPPRISPYNP